MSSVEPTAITPQERCDLFRASLGLLQMQNSCAPGLRHACIDFPSKNATYRGQLQGRKIHGIGTLANIMVKEF